MNTACCYCCISKRYLETVLQNMTLNSECILLLTKSIPLSTLNPKKTISVLSTHLSAGLSPLCTQACRHSALSWRPRKEGSKKKEKEKDGGRSGEVASLPHFREQDVVFLAFARVVRLCLCTGCTSEHHIHISQLDIRCVWRYLSPCCCWPSDTEMLKWVKVELKLLLWLTKFPLIYWNKQHCACQK